MSRKVANCLNFKSIHPCENIYQLHFVRITYSLKYKYRNYIQIYAYMRTIKKFMQNWIKMYISFGIKAFGIYATWWLPNAEAQSQSGIAIAHIQVLEFKFLLCFPSQLPFNAGDYPVVGSLPPTEDDQTELLPSAISLVQPQQ